jgi:DNA modification methylase
MNHPDLYLGDAMEIMADFPDGCIDAAVFDPPYKTIGGGTPDDDRRPSGILESNDTSGS